MTDTGGHHRHTVLVAVSKSKIVFHRAARLDDCRNTFLSAILRNPGKGKKASLAITAPFRSKPKFLAFSIACFKASTRLVCPTPLASSCLPLASTIALDFAVLHNLVCEKAYLQTSSAVEPLVVTVFQNLRGVSTFRSGLAPAHRSAKSGTASWAEQPACAPE